MNKQWIEASHFHARSYSRRIFLSDSEEYRRHPTYEYLDIKYRFAGEGVGQQVISGATIDIDTAGVCPLIQKNIPAVLVDVLAEDVTVDLSSYVQDLSFPKFYADLVYTDSTHVDEPYPSAQCTINFSDIPGTYAMTEDPGVNFYYERQIPLNPPGASIDYTITCINGSYLWEVTDVYTGCISGCSGLSCRAVSECSVLQFILFRALILR